MKVKTKVREQQLHNKVTEAKYVNLPPLSLSLSLFNFKVCKERIRVLEFMRDYDKLRSGRISLTSFRRALDLCGFELSPPEVVALENRLTCYDISLHNVYECIHVLFIKLNLTWTVNTGMVSPRFGIGCERLAF